jgi:hypothetical protein
LEILYLDSCGDTSAPKKGSSKYYVLAGISVDPIQWHTTKQKLEDIIDATFSQVGQPPDELHYTDIINKRHPYDKVDGKKLADEVFGLISSLSITIFGMVLNKYKHWSKYAKPYPPDLHMLEAMTNRFEKYLARKNEIGLMVWDKTGSSDLQLLKKFEEYKKGGTSFLKPKHIVDTLFFTPSETSIYLQLVDFVAYAIFSNYERNKQERFNQIKHLMDQYGLKVFP